MSYKKYNSAVQKGWLYPFPSLDCCFLHACRVYFGLAAGDWGSVQQVITLSEEHTTALLMSCETEFKSQQPASCWGIYSDPMSDADITTIKCVECVINILRQWTTQHGSELYQVTRVYIHINKYIKKIGT